MNYALALERAIAAAKHAGSLLRAEFHRPGGPRGTLSSAGGHGAKAGVDDAAEDSIRAALAQLPGSWGFLGEEGGHSSANADASGPTKDASAENGTHYWVVDPNDGTSHFLNAERASAVSVGLLRNGVPVLGVVYAFGYPDDRGDLVAWAEGQPFTRNGKPVDAPRLDSDVFADAFSAASQNGPHGFRMNALVPRSVDHRLQPVAPFLGLPYVSLPSIAYRLAKLACRDATICISLHGLSAWDVMAGHALIRATGGTLVNQEGVEVTYTSEGKFANAGLAGAKSFFAGSPAGVKKLVERKKEYKELMAVLHAKPRIERESVFRLLPAARGSRRCADPDKLSRIQGALVSLLSGGGQSTIEAIHFARSLIHNKAYKPTNFPPSTSSDPLSRACILGLFGSLAPESSDLSPEVLAAQDSPSSTMGADTSVACRAIAEAARAAVETGSLEAVRAAAARTAEGNVAELLDAATGSGEAASGSSSDILAVFSEAFGCLRPEATFSCASSGPAACLFGALHGLDAIPAIALRNVQTRREGLEGTWTCDVLEVAEALGFRGAVWDKVSG